MNTRFEIWAQFILCESDSESINDFFVNHLTVSRKRIIPKLHLTVYHSRRPMFGVNPLVEEIRLVLPTRETRFMVMKPEGINPNPNIKPSDSKVGIRIQKQSCLTNEIKKFRERLSKFENQKVLGKRHPSSYNRNAFGSKYYIPHIALLRPHNGIDNNLFRVSDLFKEKFNHLTFDKFIIDINKAKRF